VALSLVETVGDFQLVDNHNQLIPAHRPAVVEMSHFFQARALLNQLRLVAGELKDTATDKEFASYWRESAGDRELAIESFLSAFGPKAVEPEPDAPRGKKAK